MAEYADRNPRPLEPYYCRHVEAMTAEGLHAKSDIAAELAFRDATIASLRAEAARLREAALTARNALLDEAEAHDVGPECSLADSFREAAQLLAKALAAPDAGER